MPGAPITQSLNVAAPPDVAAVLRRTADSYRESAAELASAWQDPRAGKPWEELAKVLDFAARRADAVCAKHWDNL